MPDPHAASTSWAGLRVVVVHDWLTGMRGGEKVLESFCRMFPGADLLTLLHVPHSVSATIESHPIRSSFVQRLPRSTRLYRYYLPLFPTAIEMLDVDDADVVISTSHCAAKAIVAPNAVHICYCHSPMRYGWDQFDAYFGRARLGRLGTAAIRPVVAWLARWDRATTPRVHRFVANSRHVADRIARYYNRRASILYPPVDTHFFAPDGGSPDRYFLMVSALVPYKRIEIAMHAAERIAAPLKIVGTGPEESRLRAIAGSGVEFLGRVTDTALRDLYRRAQALVQPAEEDFGIAPVEALACGRPVVALARGGARESVEDGVTGALVEDARPEAFADAMRSIQARTFDSATLHRRAEQFSVDRFEHEFRSLLSETLANGGRW